MSQPLEESKENQTNNIPYDLLPDNTFTIILKAKGKVYALGGEIGVIEPDIHDEDLDSVLRAINGAGLTLQRTVAVAVAGRNPEYKLPGDHPAIEEDLTPKVEEELLAGLYIAGADIKQGQALHMLPDGKVVPIETEPIKKEEPEA